MAQHPSTATSRTMMAPPHGTTTTTRCPSTPPHVMTMMTIRHNVTSQPYAHTPHNIMQGPSCHYHHYHHHHHDDNDNNVLVPLPLVPHNMTSRPHMPPPPPWHNILVLPLIPQQQQLEWWCDVVAPRATTTTTTMMMTVLPCMPSTLQHNARMRTRVHSLSASHHWQQGALSHSVHTHRYPEYRCRYGCPGSIPIAGLASCLGVQVYWQIWVWVLVLPPGGIPVQFPSPSSSNCTNSYFKKTLNILSSPPFYTKYIVFPSGKILSLKILHNPKFYPFFQHAMGAVDSSHIPISPPSQLEPIYWNRKGFLSQNTMFICDFNLRFTYTLTGWEGSVTDARIIDMLSTPIFTYLLESSFLQMQVTLYNSDSSFTTREYNTILLNGAVPI